MFSKRIGAAVFAIALLMPAGAAVSASAMPDNPGSGKAEQGKGNSDSKAEQGKGSGKGTCRREAKDEFKTDLKSARKAKKAVYREAKDAWLDAMVDQRAAREAALAVATTDEERQAAEDAFSAAMLGEKEERQAVKKEARKAFKAAKKKARKAFKAAKKDCRNS